MNSKFNKVLLTLIHITIVLAMIGLLYVGYLVIFPIQVFKLNSAKVISHEVRAGEALMYELDYCKKGEYNSTVTRSIIDGIVYSFPQVMGNLEPGCHKKEIVAVVIPAEGVVPSGKYYLKVTVEYDINPLHKETTTFQTDSFEIIGK